MKHLSISQLTLALIVFSLVVCPNTLIAESITLDLTTATNINGHPVAYSQNYGSGYYDLTDVWEHTYNNADSCQAIMTNDGVFSFSHLPSGMSYGNMSWEGFTLSTVSQDTANVLGCVANGGLGGVATPYVIGYYSEWVSAAQGYSSNIVEFNDAYYPEYVYICQNSNTYKAITQGEYNSRPFTTEDTLALIIQALDSTMTPTATTTYYLAVDGEHNNGWVKVSLGALGKTSCIGFSMTTTDIGAWGANTPMYFALDGLTINTEPVTAIPNTPMNPKYNSHKIVHNGQLYIVKNGKYYNAMGQSLKQQ